MKKSNIILVFLMLASCNFKESKKQIQFEVIDSTSQSYGEHRYHPSDKQILGKIKITNFYDSLIIYPFNDLYLNSWYIENNQINKHFDESALRKQIILRKDDSRILYFRIPEKFDTIYVWFNSQNDNKFNSSRLNLVRDNKDKIIFHSLTHLSSRKVTRDDRSTPFFK